LKSLTFRVEGRAVFPPLTRDGASANDRGHAHGDRVPDGFTKGREARFVALKRQPNHIGSLVFLTQVAFGLAHG
jgi:hypothetical protein